jgi:hypothetical protein
LEETKRRKLARKCEKLVELMMVSGVPTASGYEERIQFSEIEVVERGAQESGLLVNMPEGNSINGWDVNVAAVRTTSIKRTVRYHSHAVSSDCHGDLLDLLHQFADNFCGRNSLFELDTTAKMRYTLGGDMGSSSNFTRD